MRTDWWIESLAVEKRQQNAVKYARWFRGGVAVGLVITFAIGLRA